MYRDPAHPKLISLKGTQSPIDIGIRTIYGQRSVPLKSISPKGTENPIDIGILTVYALRSGPLKFISQIGT